MHPEEAGLIGGGRPRGEKKYPASSNEIINLMGEVMTMINTCFYYHDPNLGDNSCLKSGNKYNVNVLGDQERAEMANEEVADIRDIPPNAPEALFATQQSKGHNCYELSLLAREAIKAKGTLAHLVDFSDADHFITVCENIPESLPADMTPWPTDSYICDVYTNIRCTAPEFPKK